MNLELYKDLLKLLDKHKLVDPANTRKLEIKLSYMELKDEGLKAKDAFEILSKKYYLSEKSIQRIIYQK